MANPEIFILGVLRAVVEVALLALVAQGAVGLLSGSRRSTNPIYQLFQVVTGPAIRLVRKITPKAVIDRHIPYATFFLLFWIWIFLAYAKRSLCQIEGLAC